MIIRGLIVRGDSGTEYKITVHPSGTITDDKPVIYCTCPAWRFTNLPVQDRTCKHIEFARTTLAGALTSA